MSNDAAVDVSKAAESAASSSRRRIAAVMRTKRAMSAATLTTVAGVVAILVSAPFAWMFLTSFMTPAEASSLPITLWPASFDLANYEAVFEQAPLARALLNSVIVTAVGLASSIIVSVAAGYAFAKLRFRGRKLFFILVLALLMMPFEVKVIPLYLIFGELGLLNTYLGIALPGMASAIGVFFMRQFIAGVPDSYLEAARLDGAGEIRILASIVAPLLKPAIATLAVVKFVLTWNSFLWPLVAARDEAMMTLPVALTLVGNANFVEYPELTAAACIAVLPVVVVTIVLQRQVQLGMLTIGVKH